MTDISRHHPVSPRDESTVASTQSNIDCIFQIEKHTVPAVLQSQEALKEATQ